MDLLSSKAGASPDEKESLLGKEFGKEDATSWTIPFNDLGEHMGFRRFHVYLLLVNFVVQIPAAAAFGPAPYVQRHVRDEFQVSNAIASLVGTSLIFGSCAGAPLCGMLSDRYGRRWCLLVCVLGLSLVNLLHLVIPWGHNSCGFGILMIVRLLVGVFYGGLLTQVIPYLIEFFPDNLRGFAATSMNLSWPLGSIFAILVVRFCEPLLGWRFVFAIAPVIPGTLSVLMLLSLPESPRWLFLQGRITEAQQTLDHIFAQRPLYGYARYGKAPTVRVPQKAPNEPAQPRIMKSLPHLFGPNLRWTTFVASTLYIALCGVSNCQWAWGPHIISHIAGTDVGLDVFVYANWAAIVGSCMAMALIDSVGRRPLLAMNFLISAILFAAFVHHEPRALICVLWALLQIPDTILWSTLGCYMSEAFPTSIRGTAVGFTVIWGRLASVLFPIGAGVLIGGHTSILLWIFAAVYVASFMLAMLIPRETAGAAISDELDEVLTARSLSTSSRDSAA